MSAGSRSFLEGILDYAGLFPPAQLPFEQSVRNYLDYRCRPEAWMLGRFVCPAARLGELVPFAEEFADAPLRLSVLGRGGNDVKEFFDHVREDLADIRDLERTLGQAAGAETYEVRLPTGLFTPPRAHPLSALVGTVAHLIETAGINALAPFFECPVFDVEAVKALLLVLADDRGTPEARQRHRCGRPGWKLRCGGLEAAAFPTPRQVALVLAGCCAARLPWKGTAGLHHPLRRFDAGVNTVMHGFVNVFAAGILAHAGQLDEYGMEELLTDEEAGHFVFDDDGFAWKTFRATVAQIRAARRDFVTSFGSCSFEEPLADLHHLSWL